LQQITQKQAAEQLDAPNGTCGRLLKKLKSQATKL
jgi:hypothetical protein